MIVAEPRTPSYGVAHIGLASISHQPTFCSLLAKGGASAAAIRNLAGHSNVAITDRDMHLAPGEDAAAVRLLERSAKQEPARRQAEGPNARGGKQGEPTRARRKKRVKSKP